MSLQDNTTEFFDLFSDKFYEALNSDSSDLSKYDHKCNEITVHHPRDEMIKICKKYLRYLEYCKLLHDDISLYNVSILFNYWLYGMLTHIYGANSTEKIITGFSALKLKWTYFDYRRRNEAYYLKCKPNFEMVNHNDWDKQKKLYDYYVDYDILIGLARSIPDNVLSKLSCHEKNAQEQADSKIAERPYAMKHTSARHVTGFEIEVIYQNSQIGTEVGHSVLAVTLVLLTFTAFYRYKPVGSWVRKLRGYSPNSINDMDGYSIDTEASGDMLFDGSSNHISYQPM
ncbi:PIR Superfamily Protein [Plasmodium ovale curtisi]|uniref:PIR Superfamily Protein n=1 Tax=Plasmodium ovale curtisi TaxID=864141 RepID=A0A1A8WN89_PLAOA|nr:PIR Superfamily Protein [Plasmodium ovale curtisi]